MPSNELKEFVVAIGFKLDEDMMRRVTAYFRKFESDLEETAAKAEETAASFEGVGKAIARVAVTVAGAVGSMVGAVVLLEKGWAG